MQCADCDHVFETNETRRIVEETDERVCLECSWKRWPVSKEKKAHVKRLDSLVDKSIVDHTVATERKKLYQN